MPVALGAFISDEVYDGKLRSEHRINDMECVAFVDAAKGQEEKCGTSWRVRDYVRFPQIETNGSCILCA
jgi:regulator of nonsense transcripts 1